MSSRIGAATNAAGTPSDVKSAVDPSLSTQCRTFVSKKRAPLNWRFLAKAADRVSGPERSCESEVSSEESSGASFNASVAEGIDADASASGSNSFAVDGLVVSSAAPSSRGSEWNGLPLLAGLLPVRAVDFLRAAVAALNSMRAASIVEASAGRVSGKGAEASEDAGPSAGKQADGSKKRAAGNMASAARGAAASLASAFAEFAAFFGTFGKFKALLVSLPAAEAREAVAPDLTEFAEEEASFPFAKLLCEVFLIFKSGVDDAKRAEEEIAELEPTAATLFELPATARLPRSIKQRAPSLNTG